MTDALTAFKVGFLARCAADGLAPAEILSRVKQAEAQFDKAASLLGSVASKAMDVGQGVAGGLAGYGIPLALLAPPVAGGMAGFGLSKATDIDDTDVDDIKDREVIDEYGRQSAKLRRQKAVRDYQLSKAKTGRIFM